MVGNAIFYKKGEFAVTPDELDEAVAVWLALQEEPGAPHATWPGLAFHLGCSTRSLLNYGKNPLFQEAISRVKTYIEMKAAESCFDPKLRAAGPIFNLKANHGYKDGSQLEVNINIGWNDALKQAKDQREGAIDVGQSGESQPRID